ncbi:hypothetical protein EDB89DRAFT_1944421 [Lactarius sanguifluus]|nr:hypothetical protein EDB89DRAFT_1944421 [Lactarius sanguifluus]
MQGFEMATLTRNPFSFILLLAPWRTSYALQNQAVTGHLVTCVPITFRSVLLTPKKFWCSPSPSPHSQPHHP